jgi:hypothetical protein
MSWKCALTIYWICPHYLAIKCGWVPFLRRWGLVRLRQQLIAGGDTWDNVFISMLISSNRTIYSALLLETALSLPVDILNRKRCFVEIYKRVPAAPEGATVQERLRILRRCLGFCGYTTSIDRFRVGEPSST